MKLHIINEFLWIIDKVHALDFGGIKRKKELRVYKNPSMSELKQLCVSTMAAGGGVGGFTCNDDVYVWNRELAQHHVIIERLKLENEEDIITFYLNLNPNDDIEIIISAWSTDLNKDENMLIDRVLNIIHKRMVDQL